MFCFCSNFTAALSQLRELPPVALGVLGGDAVGGGVQGVGEGRAEGGGAGGGVGEGGLQVGSGGRGGE